MAITPQAQALVDAFAARGMHLDPRVAQLWWGVEKGAYHNPVGVTSPSGALMYGATNVIPYRNTDGTITYLLAFPSDQAGAAAAADLVASSSYYADLRSALSAGTSWDTQLRALIKSPWNHGYYVGALSRYLPTGSGGGAPPNIPALPSSLGQSAGSLGDLWAALSGGADSSSGTFDQPSYQGLVEALTHPVPFGQSPPAGAQAYLAYLEPLVDKGVPLSAIPVPKSIADYLASAGPSGWVGIGKTNPKTGASEWPGVSLLTSPQLASILSFLVDPVNWERIGLVALGVLAGTAGFILYLRGHADVRTA